MAQIGEAKNMEASIMTDANRFTFTDPAPGDATAEVVQRFIAAFQHKNPAAIRHLVAPDCIMEAIQPAPDGLRVEGYEANVAFWQAMVADPNGSFEVEDVVISGDRATNRWRYRFGSGEGNSVRGVTLDPGPRRQDCGGSGVRQDTGGLGPGPGEPDHVRGHPAVQRGVPAARFRLRSRS